VSIGLVLPRIGFILCFFRALLSRASEGTLNKENRVEMFCDQFNAADFGGKKRGFN
jgi:hypothetical protein